MFGKGKAIRFQNRIKQNQIRGNLPDTNRTSKIGSQIEYRNNSKPDTGLIISVIFLSIFGLLMVFSASAVISYFSHDGDTFYFFNRQVIWIFLGSLLGYFFYRLKMPAIKKIGIYMIIAAVLLMIFMLPEALSPSLEDGRKVIDMPLVTTLNGATRWYDLGIFSLQPAELLKLGLIIFTASFLTMDSKKKKEREKIIESNKNSPFRYFLSALLIRHQLFSLLIGIAFLIFAQRDLDTLVIIFLIFLSIYYVGEEKEGKGVRSFFLFISALIVGTFSMLIEGYRRTRFLSFIEILFKGEPSKEFRLGESFQVWNGLVAIGSGGLFGLGYGESRQKLFFLQEASYTDSIFAVLGEEFGLLGTLLVILGFIYFLSAGLSIAKSAKDKFSSLVATGITLWIVIQAFLNIAANLAAIPFGGMPLPFFTYGGSNTIIILAGIGILLNISRQKS